MEVDEHMGNVEVDEDDLFGGGDDNQSNSSHDLFGGGSEESEKMEEEKEGQQSSSAPATAEDPLTQDEVGSVFMAKPAVALRTPGLRYWGEVKNAFSMQQLRMNARELHIQRKKQ